jgi:FdhD protein
MKIGVKQTEVLRSENGTMNTSPDLLAVEEPMEIILRYGPPENREEKKLAVTMRTPGHDLELTLGFLFSEGIVNHPDDVLSIRHCETVAHEEEKENVVKVELSDHCSFDPALLNRHFYTTSSCGVCGKSSIDQVAVSCNFELNPHIKVSESWIRQLPEKLLANQNIFEFTGGLHASALFEPEKEMLSLREDVGRHNALDKLIGSRLVEGEIPLDNDVLLVSGRASFELVQKAIRAGIPVMAAVGAPSSLAVDLAQSHGLTLVGFLKSKRFNVYSGQNRIVS